MQEIRVFIFILTQIFAIVYFLIFFLLEGNKKKFIFKKYSFWKIFYNCIILVLFINIIVFPDLIVPFKLGLLKNNSLNISIFTSLFFNFVLLLIYFYDRSLFVFIIHISSWILTISINNIFLTYFLNQPIYSFVHFLLFLIGIISLIDAVISIIDLSIYIKELQFYKAIKIRENN